MVGMMGCTVIVKNCCVSYLSFDSVASHLLVVRPIHNYLTLQPIFILHTHIQVYF